MIQLTFEHTRNVFSGTEFTSWIKKLFPNAKFTRCMCGDWYPTIEIPLDEFTANHKNIPESAQNKIAGIKTNFGQVSLLDWIVNRVVPIHKITNLHPDFEKHTGRESYGNKVEEVIEVSFDPKPINQ